ncbi:MAG: FAD-dependent oxidoreductase [Pseudoclavibacter sp.]
MSNLRVAIVGAGPAGIYAGNLLGRAVREAGGRVAIDLFESLPAPYGLIRYGVAPDHPRIKGIVTSLHEMLDAPAAPAAAAGGVDGGTPDAAAETTDDGDDATGGSRSIRFIGNVEVGRDIALAELHERYDAVILATGAIRDAKLDVPGIDLEGSYGAADFVAWYDGHPDVPRAWPLDGASVAVIGNGNVALDVARVLAKHAVDLRSTEVADNVLSGLENSAVTDVHVFGRRGPGDIKFTPIELRELGEVPGVDLVLHDEDFAGDVADPTKATNNQLKVMLRILNGWRDREPTGADRRLHLHFYHSPVEVLGDDAGRVRGVRFERTEPTGDGGVRGTGELREVEVQQVYRAVGYAGTRVEGAPFDEHAGVIPNVEGRVADAAGERADDVASSVPVRGLYATGWIKRGPVGLIGHTKSDAMETIAHLVADAHAGELDAPAVAGDVLDLLEERGVEFTTWDGWCALDAHERDLGANHEHTRERVKVVPRDEQVDIARSGVLVS